MRNRVVITGLGLVCPMGHDAETVWSGMLTGKNGFNYTTIFDASTFPSQFCAEVKDYDLAKHVKNPGLHKDSNRGSGFVLGAAVEACRQAGIDIETDNPSDGIDRTRMGIYLGAGEGSVDNDVFFDAIVKGWDNEKNRMDWNKWADIAFGKMSSMREMEQEPNMPAAHIAMLTGARGPTRSCLTACAASTQAAGEATEIIRKGTADVMLAGGAHSMIHPLGVTGFCRLTALSTRNDSIETASRPFSASRDGFVIGEGGAVVVLESLEHAKKRGAKILCEVIGYGSSSDAFRVTDMHEEARGAIQALEAALKDAGITYADVDYISTHGTSTAENDSVETKAIKSVFKDKAKSTPASSIKSMLGHLIGAAGAAELITCVLAIRDNIAPPTMNLNDPDPALDLDYVPNDPRKTSVNIAVNESFGFGGQNNVVIVKRYEP
ncbi:MAG: beta-ketoacyl-[acyl-carrier-protein] synthase family protein [Sedimentisphaerales bacterium]|nr:beta-ketoacyl-[acyl-carrier-protein] synthase family protein [Sedimentisphaerales bacterium]